MEQRPAFYSIDEFPQLHELCENWEAIRDELVQLNAPEMNINRQEKKYAQVIQEIVMEVMKGNQYGWIQGWGKDGGNYDWVQYGLMSFNEQVNNMLGPYVASILPRTFELIQNIEGVKIGAFVKLKAHSFLHCHTHPEIHDEGLLQFHLPLVTAKERNYAYLNVMGEFRQHVCGKPIIFDGSLDHFALNESDEDRTILYLEFKKNP